MLVLRYDQGMCSALSSQSTQLLVYREKVLHRKVAGYVNLFGLHELHSSLTAVNHLPGSSQLHESSGRAETF